MATCLDCSFGVAPAADAPLQCRQSSPTFFLNDPYQPTTQRWVGVWPAVGDADWCGDYVDGTVPTATR